MPSTSSVLPCLLQFSWLSSVHRQASASPIDWYTNLIHAHMLNVSIQNVSQTITCWFNLTAFKASSKPSQLSSSQLAF